MVSETVRTPFFRKRGLDESQIDELLAVALARQAGFLTDWDGMVEADRDYWRRQAHRYLAPVVQQIIDGRP